MALFHSQTWRHMINIISYLPTWVNRGLFKLSLDYVQNYYGNGFSKVGLGIEALLVQVSLQAEMLGFLSLTFYPLLSTGSTQEDSSWHDWKIVDDVKNQNKAASVFAFPTLKFIVSIKTRKIFM